jgi:hypothetical protein
VVNGNGGRLEPSPDPVKPDQSVEVGNRSWLELGDLDEGQPTPLTECVADGEPVVDVPAKLSARARVFSTGQAKRSASANNGATVRHS